MKKLTIILITVLALFMLFSNFTIVNAYDSIWDNIQDQVSQFENAGKPVDADDPRIESQQIADIAIPIFQFMISIATIVVTIVTVVMGIKYMVANPEGKAKLKQQLIGLVISAIVIWGAQGIWAIMTKFLENIT